MSEKKVALVTGASSGIGMAAVTALLEQGFTVVGTGRRNRPDALKPGAEYVVLDVTDAESIAGVIAGITERHGRIDVLVNNAGFGQLGALETLSSNQLRYQFEVNVFGAHAMSRAVLPAMRAHKFGRIINIGSVGGTFTAPGAGAYHMSKWALESFSDALRFEAKPFGIDVVHIQPTGVKTPFVNTIVSTLPPTPPSSPYSTFHANVSKGTAQMFAGRAPGIITPEAVAKTIARAATTRRPRTRYMVGFSAHSYSMMRRIVSDRVWDRVMGMAFRFPAPTS